MSKKADKTSGDGVAAKPTFTEENVARARKWFAKGQELAQKKNYDYAVEAYINGLGYWPEAVEEGHMPCRAAALFRGPKKVSFTDGMKHKTSGKDATKAMLNAEFLLSKDPRNVGYMEALFKNAAKAGLEKTVLWIGEILAEAAVGEEKPNPGRFQLLREVYEEMGDRNANEQPAVAIEALQRAVDALSKLRALKPNDLDVSTDLRDVAGKLTILKGKYSSAESFKDSIHDGEAQREIHDRERMAQSDDRLAGLVAEARKRYEANPTDRRSLNELIDLLCRREEDACENQAIDLLLEAFKQRHDYQHKQRADDIRMRQLSRHARRIVASGDVEAARKHLEEQRQFELDVFKERVRQYPTDMRVRFEYGRRLFRAKRYDDAIPVLQEARHEPRNRFACSLYIGRAFFEKGLYDQAVDTFREAISGYELQDDELGKELHYWLGRTFEGDGKIEDALKTYGQLIQWDYNYRKGDVRKRIEDLKARGRQEG